MRSTRGGGRRCGRVARRPMSHPTRGATLRRSRRRPWGGRPAARAAASHRSRTFQLAPPALSPPARGDPTPSRRQPAATTTSLSRTFVVGASLAPSRSFSRSVSPFLALSHPSPYDISVATVLSHAHRKLARGAPARGSSLLRVGLAPRTFHSFDRRRRAASHRAAHRPLAAPRFYREKPLPPLIRYRAGCLTASRV